ncbi:MAG TPA: FtsK/SpoIIIE domain-containing protein [Acidimicrobiales bacterium]|nr:FtsK/SpoIIIE domain-containing protein [Acidimicrobiales bacterium]
MQIVFHDGHDRRELDVRINSPSATVGDLARALAPTAADAPLIIGGQPVDADFDLTESGLHEGATVRFGPGPAGGPRRDVRIADRMVDRIADRMVDRIADARELVVVNGLDAGRRIVLQPGTVTVGRAAGCEVVLRDATLSRRHATLTVGAGGDVTVDDLQSHNGTWVDGEPVTAPVPLGDRVPLRMGALDLEVRPVREDDRPVAVDPLRHATAGGTIPFNRPPRPAPPPAAPEVRAPDPPKGNQSKVPLGLISILTPLVLSGAMYAMTKSASTLMFAGLTPLMGIATAVDGKRKGRKSERGEKERFRRELAGFRRELAAVADGERARREALFPDPAEIARRVTLPSTALWERRPGHGDFLCLRAGVGDVRWDPPVDGVRRGPDMPGELAAALDEAAVLTATPVPVDLSAGGVVGIVGDRSAALALARSLLCQAAALHGPADMPVMVLARPAAAADWDWAKWLPHTRDATGARRNLSADPELSVRMVDARLKAHAARDRNERRPLGNERPSGPTLLVVVDDESLTEGRKAPTRQLLRGDGGLVAGIVVASTADRLPAVCTTVVEMTDPDGGADLTLPQRGEHVSGFLPAGMADDVARDCARALARFEDAELDVVGAGLPASIRLLPLLGLEECTPDAVLARWKAGGVDPRPAAPIGVSEDGVFTVDFVADGPHGLVGGTTGAGKSELLRTMVAGLAASVDPDHLTFVLIDFKGGSAFDECARLPHTVGMVTDLDEHLAERALRCLEAELKYRERTLRRAGAVDLPDYLRSNRGGEPMPRLLVIIDEFATLKSELPEFIDALVGVAQRGRSLGVHMLLATQRPQGAINENIKANTNMRIALRVQEASDSADVIDVRDAASIPRTAPGRAYVRLGPGEVVAIQSALSTGSRGAASQVHVDVAPFVYGPEPRVDLPPPVAPGAAGGEAGEPDETDLSVLVATIDEAYARTGRPAPRRPWPDPLPTEVDLDALIADADRRAADAGEPRRYVPLALADDPEAQAQYPMGWNRSEGNLILYGIGGSGTTTALTGLALSLAATTSADEVQIYAVDFGAGELGALAPLPHVGAVIAAGERERQTRLIRYLRGELDRRREEGPDALRRRPALVTLVDGWSAFVAEYSDYGGMGLWDAFTRVFADGPEVGLYTVVAADRAAAVAGPLASLVRQRLALRLADRNDYSMFGVRGSAVPDMHPGMGLVVATAQVVQIARPAGGAAAAAVRLAAACAPPATPPVPIEALPAEVRLADVAARAELGSRPWTIPIGLAEVTRGPASLVAYQGEHVLIAGPARSGKSTALLTVAAAVRAVDPRVRVVAVAGPRSPVGADSLVDHTVLPADVGEGLPPLVEPGEGRVVVLVDDAESFDDAGGVLERLSTSDRLDLLVVAAGRNDGIRSGYSHWTRQLRRSKLGVLLRPDIDLDGDILGVQIPRRAPVAMTTGRGYVASSGAAEMVQVAFPH